MKIHEFRAKQLFRQYGIPVPWGAVASTRAEAEQAARDLGGGRWMVKAQICAGGRSTGHFRHDPGGIGGVRFSESVAQVGSNAEAMLGQTLITEQTGPSGREVRRVYVEEACPASRELYLAMLVDRRTSRVTLLVSAAGGNRIESVASISPESVLKLPVDPRKGLQPGAIRPFIAPLGLEAQASDDLVQIAMSMYGMFLDLDASLIEINPCAVMSDGRLSALDATMTFDDNALFRHEDLRDLRDEDELAWGELDATLHGLNYVKLDGDIGCIANGAGLAMAVVDVVKVDGGEPANFLDIPPAVEVERAKYAFELVLSDPAVKAVLVNIFGGGIMRCDTVADAMLLAYREMTVQVPVIVRFAGVNGEFARVRLKDAGIPVIFAQDLGDAAQKAVQAAHDVTVGGRRNWWERMKELLARQHAH